jgi:hypothetical protein
MTVVPEPGAPADPEPGAPADPELAGRTGHPAVDEALNELDATADLDPAQQVAAYEQAHKALSQTLAAIDQS